MINFKVSKKYNKNKIVNVIQYNFPNLSSSIIYKTLRKKDILVNGKRVKENILVFENDEILAYIPDKYFELELDIIYEDENILIINKPCNIPVTEDINNTKSLTSYIQEIYPSAMPCHRLDRNTSGLVVFSKNKKSLDILLQKFKKREIEKYYVCLVYGIPKENSKELSSYLFKDTKKSIVYISDKPKKGYQTIITSYKILKTNPKNNTSLLEVQIKTGRTHQIRAQLAHIGYPIIGDGKYGINKINQKFNQKTQLLMSYKIKFSFKEDSDILNYLKNKEFNIPYENIKQAQN